MRKGRVSTQGTNCIIIRNIARRDPKNKSTWPCHHTGGTTPRNAPATVMHHCALVQRRERTAEHRRRCWPNVPPVRGCNYALGRKHSPCNVWYKISSRPAKPSGLGRRHPAAPPCRDSTQPSTIRPSVEGWLVWLFCFLIQLSSGGDKSMRSPASPPTVLYHRPYSRNEKSGYGSTVQTW